MDFAWEVCPDTCRQAGRGILWLWWRWFRVVEAPRGGVEGLHEQLESASKSLATATISKEP